MRREGVMKSYETDRIYCDACGRNMTSIQDVSIFGCMLSCSELDESCDTATRKAVADQLGDYEVRDYHICYSCMLRSWGVKVPRRRGPAALADTEGQDE
jgi:hypothetical protein